MTTLRYTSQPEVAQTDDLIQYQDLFPATEGRKYYWGAVVVLSEHVKDGDVEIGVVHIGLNSTPGPLNGQLASVPPANELRPVIGEVGESNDAQAPSPWGVHRMANVSRRLRAALSRAYDAAAEMERAVKRGDPMQSTVSAGAVIEALDEAWKYSDAREEDWQKAAILIMAALKAAEWEQLNQDQAAAVNRVLYSLRYGRVTASTRREIAECLEDVGLDPWRVFAAPS